MEDKKITEQQQEFSESNQNISDNNTSENINVSDIQNETTNDNQNNTTSSENTAEANNNQSEQPLSETELLMKKNAELQQQLNELNDKHIRLLAEFDNFRKRTRKEKEDLLKYAGEEVWKQILPILDDFERAIKENQNTNDVENIKKGFELIYNKMKNIASKNNLVAVDSIHKNFDAEIMEAITKVPAPSEDMKGKVIDELEKAYQLNDKIIRYAKVVVAE